MTDATNPKIRRWVIAGGGTGGHVTPALALAELLRDDGDATLFIGTNRGMEKRLVPAEGFDLVTLGSRPLVGRSFLERIAAIFALVGATLGALRELRRFRPHMVLSVGGYAAVPVTLAAVLLRIPIALLEPNALPGRANRAVARFARLLFLGFEAGGRALARGPDDPRLRRTGIPLRRSLFHAFGSGREDRQASLPVRLFIFGGSQGARQINDTMIQALGMLDPEQLEIVHQTGEADRGRVGDAYAKAGYRAEVLAFERDMASRYAWSDLVLSRAGAITVAELALAGRPSILVPLAHVGGGEQLGNAEELQRLGAALVLDSRHLTAQALAETLRGLCTDPGRLAEMGERAAELARPDAARTIIQECRALLEGHEGCGADREPEGSDS